MRVSDGRPVPVTPAPQDPANLNDGRTFAFTRSDAYIAISPNADFVPEPPVGLVRVHLCEDFRYGIYDPIQWPQVFSYDFEYLCAIRRRNAVERLYPRIWDSPSEGVDFDVLQGAIFKNLGRLSNAWFAPINKLVDELAREAQDFSQGTDSQVLQLRRTMLDARNRVLHFPSTFRDACMQLRTVQRYWLMCRAYLDFARMTTRADSDTPSPVDISLMGAFTTDPAVAQLLHRAGIPVWHIRPKVNIDEIVVDALVTTEQPKLVCQALESGASPIYTGLVGPALFRAVSRRAHLYLDVSRSPLLIRYDQETFRASTSPPERPGQRLAAHERPQGRGRGRANSAARGGHRGYAPYNSPHPSHTRGRDKTVDPVHDWMPRRLHSWDLAMRSVDRSAPAKRQEELWGYWTPEPALLLGPQNIERARRYIKNWLRIRPAWLYLLEHPYARITRVQPQWWRDYLNGEIEGDTPHDETRRSKRLEQVRCVFQVAFDMKDYAPVPDQPIHWFTHRITDPPSNLCPLIVWELHEIGFRYELLALDRVLVPMLNVENADSLREELLSHVFPDHDLYYVHDIPESPRGLCATIPAARVRSLEAFRQVLVRWPLCPQPVRGTDRLALTSAQAQIETVEVAMVTFYVQTFFAYSGRPPIVPHALPPFRVS
ncbi:hypothetical protein OH76DRAFT_1489920 [Lentinus brumalis]|uniref:Uncharacterized protein n=1 Tax=Lentinus brumalis TaxID=2498619 RepID=A0A371CKV6_9APHY|nr:hypothetical protein OH76DRAFT_1489920 [Polyporus brumalis]